jgi:hypothetical protein
MIPYVKVFSLLFVVSIFLLVIEQTRESNLYAYGHYFTTNQSAEFLSLIHQIDVELALTNNTFPSQIDAAYYHGGNAVELMNKTYHLTNAISPVDFRIIYEEERLNNNDNSTVQALVVANIADEILRKYGDAYDIEYDLTNMSNMLITQSISAHERGSHSNIPGNNDDNRLVLVSMGDYQSAQALSREAINIFESKLWPLARHENNESNAGMIHISKVKGSLVELNNLLNNKASPEDLMKFVHTQIHPDLHLAYNLELENE